MIHAYHPAGFLHSQASPIFTNLQIQDPTASEGVLSITLALNEAGA